MNTKLWNLAAHIRCAQWVLAENLRGKAIKNPVHLAIGHELAAAFIVQNARFNQDLLCVNHRNMHLNIGMSLDNQGPSLRAVMREILGFYDGLHEGRLGSMNLVNPPQSIVYASSILGNALSIASGLAFRKRGEDSQIYCFVGDGAIEEGRFWEAAIFASAHRLNLCIVVENNGWSMQSSISQRREPIDLKSFSESLGFSYKKLDSRIVDDWSQETNFLAFKKPKIIEIDVVTEGGYMVEAEYGGMRQVNYHCNALPTPRDFSFSEQFGLSEDDLITEERINALGLRSKLESFYNELKSQMD